MTAAKTMKIIVKSGPAPSPRPRRGRAGRWAEVYAAIEAMHAGEWFAVPGLEKATDKERIDCISCIRVWLRSREIDGVEVYRDESDAVIVRCT